MTTGDSAARFFLLTYILTIPFLILGSVVKQPLLPGLPVTALMFVCPTLAALAMISREAGTTGAKAFLQRSFDYKRIQAKRWYLPTLLLCPAMSVMSFIVLRMTGTAVPKPHETVGSIVGLSVAFFVAAAGEELGWTGYALEPLEERLGALGSGLLIGAVWAVWHFVALIQIHRSADWIGWWSLYSVALRVIMVWLYLHAGRSVFAVSLLHALSNVCWQIFPVHGSFFEPRVTGMIAAGVAVALFLGERIVTVRNSR